jgi:hypothetical protein
MSPPALRILIAEDEPLAVALDRRHRPQIVLPKGRFARISRFAVVNLAHVSALKPRSNGDQSLFLRNGSMLTLMRTRRRPFVALPGREH